MGRPFFFAAAAGLLLLACADPPQPSLQRAVPDPGQQGQTDANALPPPRLDGGVDPGKPAHDAAVVDDAAQQDATVQSQDDGAPPIQDAEVPPEEIEPPPPDGGPPPADEGPW